MKNIQKIQYLNSHMLETKGKRNDKINEIPTMTSIASRVDDSIHLPTG